MSIENSFNFLSRSYNKIRANYQDITNDYQRKTFARQIKLTEKSNKNIRTRAFAKLSELHNEKWGYKNEITELNEALENIRVKIMDSNISDVEKAQLRYESQMIKLERDKKVKILPRKMERIQQKMSKNILEARRDIAINEQNRPIKVSEITINKIRKVISVFEAIGNCVKEEIARKYNKNPENSNENLGLVQSEINVSDINFEEVESAINNKIEEEEESFVADNSEDVNSIAQQVSDLVDSNIGNIDVETQVSDFVNSNLNTDSVETQVSENNISEEEQNIDTIKTNDIESMFGIGKSENVDKFNVEIPPARIVETPVEEEINQKPNQETMEDYASKLESLESEFSIAANKGDIDKLQEIKANMFAVVSSINSLKEKEQRNFENAQAEEQEAKEKEEEARAIVINGLTREITSLFNDGGNGINYVNSLQQKTSATVARTKQIEDSIKTLTSYATNDNKDYGNISSELDSMFEQTVSDSMTDSISKSMR